MRIAYLDAFAGVSGDMLLGAFIHAGVSVDVLRETLDRLDLGATLEITEVDRSGIHAVKVNVLTEGQPVEVVHGEHQHFEPDHDREHSHVQNGGSHHHHHGQKSSHQHHAEHRSLGTIRALIERATLPGPVTTLALRTFELLGESEAKIHHVPIDSVHFHEVGSVDAIADIVLTAAAVHALGIEEWHCSPLNVGGGTVECAHGRFPVPAPATADLLRGAPTYSSGIQAELVTPTGAALVRALNCRFGPSPAMRTENIGYGAGTRNPVGFANVLRLMVGEVESVAKGSTEMISVIETAVDDLNPQIIAYVTERALQSGAMDVMCTPVIMKKNRPGTLITILATAEKARAMENLLLRETSTLGLRVREERRICLQREYVPVMTEWGPVRIKVGLRNGTELNAAAEFEDCRAIAETKDIPLKRVMESALLIYRAKHSQ
jgi:uncharacterized protein (TIGR00299 family) protein